MIPEFAATLTDEEERLGASILEKALVAPCRLIASNAGVEGDVIVNKVSKAEWRMGYNAMTDTFEDLLASGVIDPKKVTRSGLQNAVSVAGMVLTTQAIVTEVPKKKMRPGMNGQQDMDDMMTM